MNDIFAKKKSAASSKRSKLLAALEKQDDPPKTQKRKSKSNAFKSRIKELRFVKAGDILPNPKNWRTHPFAQRSALRQVLTKIGFADAAIARETPDGLMLLDGHARKDETDPDVEMPVLIVDLNDEEADIVLRTLDPLAAMAESDEEMMHQLAKELANVDDAYVKNLLDVMEIRYDDLTQDERAEKDKSTREQKKKERVESYEFEYKVIIQCANEKEQTKLLERFRKEGLKCQALML